MRKQFSENLLTFARLALMLQCVKARRSQQMKNMTHWIMKASVPEDNQFNGNCFRMVHTPFKIYSFEIMISRPTPLDCLQQPTGHK